VGEGEVGASDGEVWCVVRSVLGMWLVMCCVTFGVEGFVPFGVEDLEKELMDAKISWIDRRLLLSSNDDHPLPTT
jgi:hypothetical protein